MDATILIELKNKKSHITFVDLVEGMTSVELKDDFEGVITGISIFISGKKLNSNISPHLPLVKTKNMTLIIKFPTPIKKEDLNIIKINDMINELFNDIEIDMQNQTYFNKEFYQKKFKRILIEAVIRAYNSGDSGGTITLNDFLVEEKLL